MRSSDLGNRVEARMAGGSRQEARGSKLEVLGSRLDTVGIKSEARLNAGYPFKRFKPEVVRSVRKVDITGQTYVEQARKAREMLMSLDPEKVKQVIEFHKGLNLFQALALAQREGSLIVPNGIHDRILTETTDPEERSSLGDRDRRSRDKQYLIQNYPACTGTLVIYEKPNVPLLDKVVFSWLQFNRRTYSISFVVPEQFQGKANCALVVEHPDFELMALGNNRYELKVDAQYVHKIEDFPEISGWYMPHAETGIPHGKKVEASSDSRYLWRIDKTHICSVGRIVGDFGVYDRRYIGAIDFWSARLGVAFMPLNVTPEKSDSHD